jgi:hypothetical protein
VGSRGEKSIKNKKEEKTQRTMSGFTARPELDGDKQKRGQSPHSKVVFIVFGSVERIVDRPWPAPSRYCPNRHRKIKVPGQNTAISPPGPALAVNSSIVIGPFENGGIIRSELQK